MKDQIAAGSKEIVRIFIEPSNTLVILMNGDETRGYARIEPVRHQQGIPPLIARLEMLLRRELNVPGPPSAEAALVRGYIMAVAGLARYPVTPVDLLKVAGISRKIAVEAGTDPQDLEVIDEGGWGE